MKKRWILTAVLMLMMLTGCKGTFEEHNDAEKVNAADEDIQEESSLEDIRSNSTVLEDEEAVYICGTGQICKLDKESREVTALWESETNKPDMYAYAEGKALLIDDKIYFVQYDREVYTEKETLSVINTDGTGYRELEELESWVSAMYYQGHAVYVYFYQDGMRAYEIGEEGELSFSDTLTESAAYKVPEGYRLIKGLTPFESVENYGYIFLVNSNYELVMINPRTGEETVCGENVEAMNREYFVFSTYNTDEDCKELYLRNAQTLETKLLAKLESGGNDTVVGMDEDFVYLVNQEYGGRENGDYFYNYNYEKIALKDGERSSFFTISAGNGVQYYTPYEVMDFTIRNGYIYYIRDKDFGMYLMRRRTDDIGTEEILGEPYYDKGFGKVGKIEAYYEKIYSQVKPEVELAEVTIQQLVVDEKYAGAAQINRVLSAYREDCLSYERNSVKWEDEELEKNGEDFLESKIWYTSRPSEIAYFDGSYFSFVQQDEDYMGGAHGMPYWIGFTFDLETGDRLCLADIIGNSEEELKAIVTKYFTQYIGENPDGFWEDALETVNEGISLDSDFYLSKEGIHFYFGPYALACFAAGFQEVTVPYGELDMKLPIGEKAEEEGNEEGAVSGGEDEKVVEESADMATADHDVNGRKLPIYCVDTQEKKIALTFDAAWGNEDTEEILEILKKHDLHVTFFMTGGWVESYPDDVKAILAAGHDLGNHSENHKNMSQLSDEEKREEIMKVHEKVKEITGYDMFLFRPPYGDYDNAVVEVLMGCGYYPIQWDVDSLDWQNKGIDSIIETVTEHKNLGNGSIVLCHNGAEYTAAALETLIEALEKEGYEIVPLSELIYREDYHLNHEGRQIKN